MSPTPVDQTNPRNPYWIRIRNAGDKYERVFGGHDFERGLEVLIATEQGAIVSRVKRVNGIERVKFTGLPWLDFNQDYQGADRVIFEGAIDPLLEPARLFV